MPRGCAEPGFSGAIPRGQSAIGRPVVALASIELCGRRSIQRRPNTIRRRFEAVNTLISRPPAPRTEVALC
jgi:hypothetical protein